MLEKIMTLLNANVQDEVLETEVELASMKLENGTILEAESFEAGEAVFIKTEDEKVALPIGDYMLEDGKVLCVTEEGIIDEIKEDDADAESEEIKDETPMEEEMATEMSETEEVAEETVEVEMYATKEELSELKSAINELKDLLTQKEELAKEEAVKEELSAQQPATKPLKHNPEGEVKKQVLKKIGANRGASTMDRVYSRMFNN